MDITFGELRSKEVINTINGKRMGRVCDLVISCQTCKVTGIIVPNDRRLFHSKDDIFIPWRNIVKIGDDVILVQLYESRINCGMGNSTPFYDAHPPCGGKNEGAEYLVQDSE